MFFVLEKVTTTKLLPHFKQGFILLESLVALSVLAIGIFYYQECQLQLVTKSQQAYRDVVMLRTLYEEVAEYRQKPANTPYIVQQNEQTILITTQTYHQATITEKNRSWSIYREL